MSCWYKEDLSASNIVVSSRVRLARNLTSLPFPCRMNNDMLVSLKNKVKSAISDFEIILARTDGYSVMTLDELLPLRFDKKNLNSD